MHKNPAANFSAAGFILLSCCQVHEAEHDLVIINFQLEVLGDFINTSVHNLRTETALAVGTPDGLGSGEIHDVVTILGLDQAGVTNLTACIHAPIQKLRHKVGLGSDSLIDTALSGVAVGRVGLGHLGERFFGCFAVQPSVQQVVPPSGLISTWRTST